jgi:hypothetical protein
MRRILPLLVLATLAACGGGSDVTAPPSQTQGKTFKGAYVLQSINGKALPYTWISGNGDSVRVRSYSIAIDGAGSWTSTTSTVSSTGGQVTDQPNGGQSGSYTYSAATKAVSLISQDQSTVLTGSVSADFSTLTVSENTDIFVFKQ